MIGVCIDTTERKLADENRHRAEERTRSVVDNINDGIITIDEHGVVQTFNSSAERLFGYAASEVIGQNVKMLMPDPYDSNHDTYIANYLRTGQAKIIGIGREVVGRRKDGSTFPMDLSVSDFSLSGRRHFTGIVRDVTERKLADEERTRLFESERRARAEADKANRIKDEFLATLSHELRTPLNAILGYARILETNPSDPALLNEGLQVITRNAKIQSDLIADLLDLGSIISGKVRLDLKQLYLDKVIAEAVETIRPAAAAKDILIQSILGTDTGPIRGDDGRLQQVVWNLLSNAVKFTPKGGRVQITLAREGSTATMSVSDNGPGIAAEFLPHIFDRFRQAEPSTTRKFGGLGLGLAIARQIVELHGGVIRAESEGEGKGATFTIELPIPPVPFDMPEISGGESFSRSPEPCDHVHLEGVTILAVDDQVDARNLLSRVLEPFGAKVLTAASAKEAEKTLREHRPDIFLCDIGMPETDGFEFMKEIRSNGDLTPAIAVTAFARSEDRLAALRAGFQAHVAKPIDAAELVATIAVFVRSRTGEKDESKGSQS